MERLCPFLRGNTPSFFKRTIPSSSIFCVRAYGTEPNKKSSKKFIFSEIIQYIYDHYNEDLSLSILAEQFGYAPRSLGNMFGKYVKMDIRNFINGVRMEKVTEMRNDPRYKDKPVLELALACGFNSASSFYRAYRKNYTRSR